MSWQVFLVVGFIVVFAFAPFALSKSAPTPRLGNYAAPLLDFDAILWAIRQVESGDNPRAIGPYGERSAYQFTALTWRNYVRAPFQLATNNPQAADLVAARHLQFILGRLRARKLTDSPEFVAAAWRYGSEFAPAYARGEYARRAGNLYRERAKR